MCFRGQEIGLVLARYIIATCSDPQITLNFLIEKLRQSQSHPSCSGHLRNKDDGENMIKKPASCCAVGSYECQVPMPLNGRRQDVDLCIADIVAALNAAGISTLASCCGHGEGSGVINLEDGRELIVKWS